MRSTFPGRIMCWLGITAGLAACTSEAVNQDHMVKLEQVAVKHDLNLGDLNMALHQDRDNARLYAKRAMLYLERGETNKALADINQALELDPNKGEFHFRKALILRQVGQYPAAREAAEAAENLGFKGNDALILQAELLIRLKDYRQALEKVNLALQAEPEHEYALLYRGIARAATRDTASALINFRKAIRSAPGFLDPYLQLAALHNSLKDYVQAWRYIKAAQRLDSTHAYLWLQKGLYYQGIRRTDSAYYCLNKAIKGNARLYQGHYQLGLLHFKRKEYPAAVMHLERAKAVADTLPGLPAMLGEGYEKIGRYNDAIREYNQVLAQNPADIRAQWGVRRSTWALYKETRDSLRRNGGETTRLLDSIKNIF